MRICCKGMLKALAYDDLKLRYVPEFALLGVEEKRTIQTTKNEVPINFCPFCGRRVEQSHISDYTLCDDCFRVWEIAFPMGFQLGRECTLSELKRGKWI